MRKFKKVLVVAVGSLALGLTFNTTPVSAATASYQSSPFDAVVDIDYLPGYGVAVWTSPQNGYVIPGKYLKTGTTWRTFKVTKVNGVNWYNLGGNQWVSSQYAHLLGTPYSHTEIYVNTIATINYLPGYDIAVWTSPNSDVRVPGMYLKTGTRWKVDRELDNGELWLHVGTNQWIKAIYTQLQ